MGQDLGTTNRSSVRDFKLGQKISNRGKEISNRGKRDCKPGQGLQIGAEQSKIEPKKR